MKALKKVVELDGLEERRYVPLDARRDLPSLGGSLGAAGLAPHLVYAAASCEVGVAPTGFPTRRVLRAARGPHAVDNRHEAYRPQAAVG